MKMEMDGARGIMGRDHVDVSPDSDGGMILLDPRLRRDRLTTRPEKEKILSRGLMKMIFGE